VASYGLITEGEKDGAVFEPLIARLNNPNSEFIHRPCGGKETLMKIFPTLLRELCTIRHGQPVDKAFVIRDSDGRRPAEVLAEMRAKLGNRTFNFPRGYDLFVVVRETDTWLLADMEAVDSLKNSAARIAPVNDTLEDIADPKSLLQRKLGEAKLNYTPATLKEVAKRVSLEELANRLRGFRDFQALVPLDLE
jgi:hypothetical protein